MHTRKKKKKKKKLLLQNENEKMIQSLELSVFFILSYVTEIGCMNFYYAVLRREISIFIIN